MSKTEISSIVQRHLDRKRVAERPENGTERTYPDETFEFPHSISLDSGETIHVFQKVYEQISNPLTDDEVVEWTICSLEDDCVLLKDTNSWERKREIPVDEFDTDQYEPKFLDDGGMKVPRFGY